MQKAKVMMQNANYYAENAELLEALDYYNKNLSEEPQVKKIETTPIVEQEVTLNQIKPHGTDDQDMFDVVADEADSASFVERPSEK